jgi:hypothetical protein
VPLAWEAFEEERPRLSVTDERPVTKTEIDGTAEGIVQTIIQWRIYDTLLVILDALGGDSTKLAASSTRRESFSDPIHHSSESLTESGPIDLVADQPEPGN